MKNLLATLAIIVVGLTARTASAQSGPNYNTIETILSQYGIPYEFRSTINLGNAVGVLTQNAPDPNPQYIVFNKGVGAKGNVKFRANYYYAQPFNTSTINVTSLGDPSGQGLYGSSGTQVIIDVTKNAQITNDRSLIKLFATDGHTYILNINTGYDSGNYILFLSRFNQ